MLLQVRTIATTAAVLCFFAVAAIGSIGGLTPYTCCKRALLGAIVGYLAAGAAVRAINAILTQAMIASTMKSKERAGDGES